MQPEDEPTRPTWAERRHERFTLLARGEKKLRELVRSGQVSEAAALARQGWSKLIEAVRSTTPSALADHLRDVLGERSHAARPTESPSGPAAAPAEDVATTGAAEADDAAALLRRLRAVELGDPVFVQEGGSACGAVREAHFGATPTLTIHVENAGEFAVSARAIRTVRDGKVVLDPEHLDAPLRNAIARAHHAAQPGEVADESCADRLQFGAPGEHAGSGPVNRRASWLSRVRFEPTAGALLASLANSRA